MIDAVDPIYWESIRNKHKGKRCFVIGNGPSLTMSDLSSLKNEITIASNKVYLAFKHTDWRPTYFTIADALLLDKIQHALPSNVGTIIAPSGTRKRWQSGDSVRYFKDIGGVSNDIKDTPSFSNDIGVGAYAGYTITFFNLQLAAHLGFSQIYLLGCDHTYRGEVNVKPDEKISSKEINHFLPGYRQPGEVVNAAPIDEMNHAYRHARLFSDQTNQKIYNATRGGDLDIFERADFDTLITSRIINTTKPKVSVCLPVLDGMPYINECLNSIADQEFEDFEVCILDGGSTDGTVEAIERFKSKGYDVKFQYRKPDGIYNALNAALEMGTGEYLYIMMSDDYLKPDGLQRFVDLLDSNPDCELAHSNLEVVDASSRPLSPNQQWVTRPFPRTLGGLVEKQHKRLAPYDAIASFCLGTPYTSLTQIMFRREHYLNVGPFSSEFGSFGDLEWQMRSGMLGNTIYSPDILAVWRKHAAQASDINKHRSARSNGMFVDMVRRNEDSLRKAFKNCSDKAKQLDVFDWYDVDRARVNEHISGFAPRSAWEDSLAAEPRVLERSKLTIPIGGYENVGMGVKVRESDLGQLISISPITDSENLDESVIIPKIVDASEVDAKSPILTLVDLDRILALLLGDNSEGIRLSRNYILENSDLSMRRLEGILFGDNGIFYNKFRLLKAWQRRRLTTITAMDTGSVVDSELPDLQKLLDLLAGGGAVSASYGGAAFAEKVEQGDYVRFESSGDSDIAELIGAAAQCNIVLSDGGGWLDYGCGVGRTTRAISRMGRKVTGYDLSPIMTSVGETAFLSVQGAEQCSYVNSISSNSYDVIASLNTFQHLPKEYAISALKQLVSALKSDGTAIVHVATHGRNYRPPAIINEQTLRGIHILPLDIISQIIGTRTSIIGIVPANKINSLDIVDNYVVLRKAKTRKRKS
jgi:glycosyltransferase involved in cell wall biosynthesis